MNGASARSRSLGNRGGKPASIFRWEDDGDNSSMSKSQSQHRVNKADRKLRCLVANDDECQLYMMEVILKMNNFEVVKAQNGFEAFEKAAEAMQFTQ